jgi:hypothetical protein
MRKLDEVVGHSRIANICTAVEVPDVVEAASHPGRRAIWFRDSPGRIGDRA